MSIKNLKSAAIQPQIFTVNTGFCTAFELSSCCRGVYLNIALLKCVIVAGKWKYASDRVYLQPSWAWGPVDAASDDSKLSCCWNPGDREIASEIDISHDSALNVLRQHLGLSKVCAWWVPRLLTPIVCMLHNFFLLFRLLFKSFVVINGIVYMYILCVCVWRTKRWWCWWWGWWLGLSIRTLAEFFCRRRRW